MSLIYSNSFTTKNKTSNNTSFSSNSKEKLEIKLNESSINNTFLIDIYGNSSECPTFSSSESIKGTVIILCNKLKHNGIKIELNGKIIEHNNTDSNNDSDYKYILKDNNFYNNFVSQSKILSNKGELTSGSTSLNFSFDPIGKNFDTYRGQLFSISYYILLKIKKVDVNDVNSLRNDYIEELKQAKEICIFNFENKLERINKNFLSLKKIEDKIMWENSADTTQMEIGIENLLHVSVKLNDKKYHLKDVIYGYVFFKKLNIKIKTMVVKLVKIEKLFNIESDPISLGEIELMDGIPFDDNNTKIPIRIYLRQYIYLTSTIYNNINDNISVNYFLLIELIDEDDRSFFKKITINLYRINEERFKINETNSSLDKNNDFGLFESEENIDDIDSSLWKNLKNLNKKLNLNDPLSNDNSNKKIKKDLNKTDSLKENIDKINALFKKRK